MADSSSGDFLDQKGNQPGQTGAQGYNPGCFGEPTGQCRFKGIGIGMKQCGRKAHNAGLLEFMEHIILGGHEIDCATTR